MHDNGLARPAEPAGGYFSADRLRRVVDRFLLEKLDTAFRKHGVGGLRIALPSGEVATLGRTGGKSDGFIAVNKYRAFWRLWRNGALGFTQSYMDGDIDTDDLNAVLDFYVDNERLLTAALPSIEETRGRDRRLHRWRRNTRAGSRSNIAAHYDLGNAFYRLWLDPSMLYSSGIFTNDAATLEDAQQEKIIRVLDALALQPGQRVLEIGCGWGALAEAAARTGIRVDAITLSQQQLEAARTRIAAAGLADRVDVRFEDYRDCVGTYDRLVSIEMIEAVGEEHWPLYFGTIAERLQPAGVAVLQAITIREEAFERYKANPDFIQRYIFPGGMLPTVELMRTRAAAAGLGFETIERFGSSYALTLCEWRRRFEAAWPHIQALGFDERFRRMWLYYLTYCEVGFQRGLIDVGIYRLRKGG